MAHCAVLETLEELTAELLDTTLEALEEILEEGILEEETLEEEIETDDKLTELAERVVNVEAMGNDDTEEEEDEEEMEE